MRLRCEAVTRELAVPTGTIAPALLTEHLAACPSCAEWSRSAGRLDRIWAQTRPADPSPEVLDALWLRASNAIETIPFNVRTPVLPRPHFRHRRWAYAGVGLAMAQLAAGLLLFVQWQTARGVVVNKPQGVEVVKRTLVPDRPAPEINLTVEYDQMAVVHFDGDGHQVKLLPEKSTTGSMMAEYTPQDAMNGAEMMFYVSKLANNDSYDPSKAAGSSIQ